jgi:hypothetical protein
MRPVITARSDTVVVGPPGVGDLHAERVTVAEVPGLRTIWTLTEEERAAVAAGRNLALSFWGRMPPISLELADHEEIGVGEDDPAVRARLEALSS